VLSSLQAIPQVATAPVLVLVGAMMMGESTHIDWSCMLTAIPAFLTIVIQPFTFSIANGIYAGLSMTVMLYLLTGQWLELFRPVKEVYDEEAEAEDLETPLVNGHQATHAGQSPLPPAAAPIVAGSPRRLQEDGIPIGSVRRSSYGAATGTPMGSYRGRGTPYERGSFTMYINTFGSHTSPAARGLLGSATQPESEDAEH
jgi:AGZA family xanthine/uracil permease-like MFS transporter